MTDRTVAVLAMITELVKYRNSGTVDHMSTNGCSVGAVGSQRNSPWTWLSGLIAVVTMTTSGAHTKTVRKVSVVRRNRR